MPVDDRALADPDVPLDELARATRRTRRMNRLQALHDAGVSIWLDTLSRELLDSGEFARLIADCAVTGATSNPTIFAKAITGSERYDDQLRAAVAQGTDDPQELFFALALDDIRRAADLLRAAYDESDGRDGFISFECTPDLADDTQATIDQALELWERLDRPNVMIKVPATEAGIPAIEELTAPRRQRQHHAAVLARPLRAGDRRLHRRPRATRSRPASASMRSSSVASFFVSRVDAKADPLLPAGSDLRGRVAIANAHRAYARYRERFADERWLALREAGARPQRPLWASTGTKDPTYSDVLYVEELIAPEVINTMPEATLRAFADHGNVGHALSVDAQAASGHARPGRRRGHRPRCHHDGTGTRGRALLLRLLPPAAPLHRGKEGADRHRGRECRLIPIAPAPVGGDDGCMVRQDISRPSDRSMLAAGQRLIASWNSWSDASFPPLSCVCCWRSSIGERACPISPRRSTRGPTEITRAGRSLSMRGLIRWHHVGRRKQTRLEITSSGLTTVRALLTAAGATSAAADGPEAAAGAPQSIRSRRPTAVAA